MTKVKFLSFVVSTIEVVSSVLRFQRRVTVSVSGKHVVESAAASEQQARAVAEAARETEWAHHSFK